MPLDPSIGEHQDNKLDQTILVLVDISVLDSILFGMPING